MPISEEDVRRMRAYFEPMIGRPAWGVKLGEGSFLTLEFGERVPPRAGGKVEHGQWHLWVYFAAWKVTDQVKILIASENDREEIARTVTQLDGKTLNAVTIERPSLDLTLEFSDGIALRTSALTTEGIEQWHLYTPEGVISAGPGSSWSFEPANSGPVLGR